jgi:hypothetical protein
MEYFSLDRPREQSDARPHRKDGIEMPDSANEPPGQSAKRTFRRLRTSEKIGLALGALAILITILVASWNGRRKARDPAGGELADERSRSDERIDFRRNTVVVIDVDIRARVARIATGVKALPPGAQAEIIADVSQRDAFNQLLATERTKLVKNLLVAAGVPDNRFRVLIQDAPDPSTTVQTVDVRWSPPEP